jgi:membrane protease YdiL (CAAX protease family)
LALILLELVISIWLRIAQSHPASANWLMLHEYTVQNSLKILRVGLWLSVAYWLSGAQSLRNFAQNTGLSQRPNLLGWLGAWVAIGISFIDGIGIAKHLTSPNEVTRGFFSHGGEALLFYILFVISLGPFFEEVVMRGFLYRAFRGSYGRFLSIALVVGAGAWFHWDAVIHSLWTPACLFSLWVLLCVIREWTGSVWNCVICHAAYNAAGSAPWPFYVVGMFLLLFCCQWTVKTSQEV